MLNLLDSSSPTCLGFKKLFAMMFSIYAGDPEKPV